MKTPHLPFNKDYETNNCLFWIQMNLMNAAYEQNIGWRDFKAGGTSVI
jgi:hypothetical protein